MRPDACGHEMAASATAHCISMLQDNAGEALLVEQIGHSNLKPRPNTRTSMMRRMAWIQGLFSQEDGPNGPQVSGFFAHRTCDVTCSRMKGLTLVGEWLSLVEHLVRDQGVGGSNPLSPTIIG